MKIHRFNSPPSQDLARALAEFEKEFRYPLGPNDCFSISHAPDYSLFFRSMGEASIHLAESGGAIVGVQAVVRREVRLADGSRVPAAYFCDTKIVANRRGGIVLGKLALSASEETLGASYVAGFSVVMEGSITTDKYTGRLGIPHFVELGKIVILRFDTGGDFSGLPPISGALAFHRPEGGDSALCSEMAPLELAVDGASGILTDTRRGKRLHRSDGSEMVSAHLTALRFSDSAGLSALIRLAMKSAAAAGFPGLFVALPANLFPPDSLSSALGRCATIANATVFGTGLPQGDWMVNTSEI